MERALSGILFSAAAGAATGAGGLAAVLLRPSRRLLALSLGFAGGVMAAVSLADLLPESMALTLPALGSLRGGLSVTAALFAGMLLSLLLDGALPDSPAPDGLWRLGLLSAAALLLHNLPEGMAVFVGASADRTLGLSLAGAIALHNLPEGLCVAMPVYAASGSRKKAVGLAALSGAAEPLGALLTWALTGGTLPPLALALLFAGIAGLMTCLSFTQLFPEALLHGGQAALFGALFGVLVMVLSLCLV